VRNFTPWTIVEIPKGGTHSPKISLNTACKKVQIEIPEIDEAVVTLDVGEPSTEKTKGGLFTTLPLPSKKTFRIKTSVPQSETRRFFVRGIIE